MAEKQNTPEIRFEGFTDPWEQRKFLDVVDVCSGKDYKHLKEGSIPVYGTGGFMTSVDEALSYDRDAVGIGRKGTIDKPYLLKAPFWTVDTLFYAIPKSDIDLEFVHCCILNVDWKSKDESTGLPSLSKEAINETIALVPSFNEQSQLGEFFNNLDSFITLHQRKYDKLCTVKKSMLDKMFPKPGETEPEIRFEGFTDPWEQRKLGELTSIKTGDSDLRDAAPDGRYPFFVRSDKVERSNRYLYDGEAILVPGEGRLGEIFHYVNGKFDYHQRVYKISDFNGVTAKFVMYSMMRDFKKHALQNTAKATVDSIRLPTLTEFQFSLPKPEEQKKIGQYFSQIDSLITLHQRKLDLLKNTKKSLLDKMFV